MKKRKKTIQQNKTASKEAILLAEQESKKRKQMENTERDYRAMKRRFDIMGGSTKLVIYLVKIEKIKKLNKKLRKNKNKNKSKIEKNNKLIDELKIKT